MQARTSLLISLAALAMTSNAWAQSEIYQCVSADGKIEYRNNGSMKGCKRLDLPSNTFPSQKPVATQAAATQSAAPQAARPPAASPAGFPRVDSDTQKARDTDRRRILQDELQAEEKKLSALKKEFNNGEPERRGDERNYAKYQERVVSMRDDISRTEKNIEALQREIGNIR